MKETDKVGHAIAKEVLEMIQARGGEIRKGMFWRLVKAILTRHGRGDMNYGSWVAKDDSRILRVHQQHGDPSDAILSIAPRGYELLGWNLQVESDDLDDRFNGECYRASGGRETNDEFVARKVADPNS